MYNTVIAGYKRSPFTIADKGGLIDVKPVNLLADVIKNLTIINSNGQIIQRITPNNNIIFLNVKNYKKGSYHVISETKNDNFNKLMIVD